MKLAFMFSGQGSEYVTMCQELYQTEDTVKNIFNEATQILGYDVSDILFFNEEKLKDTTYTQPLMFVMYVSIVELLKEKGVSSTHSCGLSLGEYGALYDSDVINLETGLKLLKKRGELMKEACLETSGKMAAILGLDETSLEAIVDEVDGVITIANYNTYGQLVISGEVNSVNQAMEAAKNAGAKRVIPLVVNGAFHCELMKGAGMEFETYLDQFSFNEPNKNLYLNTTGSSVDKPIKQELTEQIFKSVRFYQMIEKIIEEGVDFFVEIGPKRTLCSFVKKINRRLTVGNVEDTTSLTDLLKKLEERHAV